MGLWALEAEIVRLGGVELEAVEISLGHPLFHAYFDITRYREAPRGCPPVAPVPGLELDGRLVAVAPPRFTPRLPCPANKLFVNALAFGLIQPSQMGGRYLAPKQETESDSTAE